VRSKGMVVNLQKVPGALVQSCNFNSICDLLNPVNFIDNHRKFRKMQTQFCWIPGETCYNFGYSRLSCFLTFLA
jgi:hypothetical protein